MVYLCRRDWKNYIRQSLRSLLILKLWFCDFDAHNLIFHFMFICVTLNHLYSIRVYTASIRGRHCIHSPLHIIGIQKIFVDWIKNYMRLQGDYHCYLIYYWIKAKNKNDLFKNNCCLVAEPFWNLYLMALGLLAWADKVVEFWILIDYLMVILKVITSHEN